MLHIAFDAKRAFHNFSGLGNYSRLLIASLAAEFPHNRYHLYTPPFENAPAFAFSESDAVILHTPRHKNSANAALWRSFGVSRDLRRDGIQLFHGLSGELPRALSMPSVVTVHDLIFMRYPRFYKLADRLIYRCKHVSACKAADRILAVSRQTADDLVGMLHVPARKIEVILQGCHPVFYRSASEEEINRIRRLYGIPDSPYLICVGTIEERKNLLALVRALPRLSSDLHIVAVGRATPYIDVVKQQISDLNLNARVHFVHGACFDHLPALYQGAQALVYPSVFEGFGLPVLEGLASGVPVITSPFSSQSEAGGEAAVYVDPTDSRKLAAAINRLLNDSSLRASCIRLGRIRAAELSPRAVAAKVFDLYNTLLYER